MKTKLRKGTFQHVESELYAYHETRREIVRLKNDIMYGRSGGDENVGGSRGNLPGDPTGRAVVLLTSHKRLEQLQAIVEAIESVVERLPEEKRKLLQLRYWTRSTLLNWEGLAGRLHISSRQAMRWRDDIIQEIAEKIGWR